MPSATDHVRLDGRLFLLSDKPEIIRAQLAGEDVTLEQALPLRDDVSTDEMTSQVVCAKFEDNYGAGLLSAYRAGTELPIGEHVLEKYGANVIVAGKRFGKGSSREHSPMAVKDVGVRLLIAESFERIFRQNCDNLGIFTSTDFGLVDRIRAGEAIPVEELVAGREPLAAELVREGGLLAYGRRHNLAELARVPVAEPTEFGPPLTLTEKILARHACPGRDLVRGQGGFVRTDWRFSHEYYTGMIGHILHSNFGRPAPLHEPDTILLFEDHLTFVHRSKLHIEKGLLPGVESMSRRHQQFGHDYGLVNHGYLPEHEGSEGICHAILLEKYALPGQILIGTDSHTTHSGAVGALAFGAGSTDVAHSMVTGFVRLTVPESLLVQLNGTLPPGVTAKDIALTLLAEPRIKAGAGLGKVFEFAGPVVEAMSIDERATLTNMTAELGGFTGLVAPDEQTVRFLQERRGVDFVVEPWMRSDPGATFAEVIRLDCSDLTPWVASPGDPGNGLPLEDLADPVTVDIAYGGSCTAGKQEDFDHYHEVLSWCAERGLRVPDNVTLYLQFGTLAVREYCIEKGYLDAFERVGAEMLLPSCGACAGCGPGSSEHAGQVTVSSINRNFPGRSGPGQVWLASPPTVAASAITGRLVSFAELQAEVGQP
jgi:3-isopropylmalate/(R)-2-methylmalate dehydratase large subunit